MIRKNPAVAPIQSFGFKRDYLLPLPTQDLESAIRRRAVYSDAVGFSRRLMLSLSVEGDEDTALLLGPPAAFWSEHSDRAGLTSWHTAMGTEKSQRGFLGRWAAQGSADSYVRTAVRVVETLQIQAAATGVALL